MNYDNDDSIISALQGQQFLIITLSVTAPGELHGRIVKAAGKAGVPYVMPNIYGGDINNKTLVEDSIIGDLYKGRLGEFENSGTSYITLVCGFWYEWSLALPEPWFGFDIRKRTVTLFDDGKTRINVSTWLQCGRAIAGLLSLPDTGASPCVSDWKNQPLYVSSFRVSQRDMLDSLHRVLGTTDADWNISYEPSDKRNMRGMDELKQGIRTGFATSLYARTFYPDGSGDYESKHPLDNDSLGLPKEDLDEATQRTVDMVEAGFVETTLSSLG